MRKCVQCGGALIKRDHESKKRFEKKRFCSSKCSRIYLKKHKMGWWGRENKSDIFFPDDIEGLEAE